MKCVAVYDTKLSYQEQSNLTVKHSPELPWTKCWCQKCNMTIDMKE